MWGGTLGVPGRHWHTCNADISRWPVRRNPDYCHSVMTTTTTLILFFGVIKLVEEQVDSDKQLRASDVSLRTTCVAKWSEKQPRGKI
jgi:hypothetical protein